MSASTDDKSYATEASLSLGNADLLVKHKLQKLPEKSFKFGSTYPFLRKSLQYLATNLSTLNHTGKGDLYTFSDNLKHDKINETNIKKIKFHSI